MPLEFMFREKRFRKIHCPFYSQRVRNLFIDLLHIFDPYLFQHMLLDFRCRVWDVWVNEWLAFAHFYLLMINLLGNIIKNIY